MKYIAILVTLLFIATVPALADQCSSDQSLGHVRHRIEGAIQQLEHDQSDYGGYKAAAIANLNQARTDIEAAKQFRIQRYGDDPACFNPTGPTGGDPFNWGERVQGSSNQDIWHVRHWMNDLIAQLQNDAVDYAGHRAAAITDLQNASNNMYAAEKYAQQHGY